jgi:PAS domain S-box-containing protein
MPTDPAYDGLPFAALNGTFNSVAGTLLLVEPNAELRNALEIHLTRMGLHVVKTSTGQEALELIKTEQPAFLISHAYLPDMSCEDLMRQTRSTSSDTAIIVMGDATDRKAAIGALRLYATNYIPIPVESDFLEVALSRAAQIRNMRIAMRRQIEQLDALHQTKVLFQQLFDEVPCYISIQDKNFRLTGANRRFKEDFGDSIGSICYETYKHQNEPCRDCPVLDTFEDGQPHQTEEVVTTKSGKKINVLTWTAPIHDASGNITQVMEMATDITQIRKLQSRLTSIGLLMGSLSHSIKGVLTALDGGIYRLESGIERGDSKRINDGADLLKDMVGRIRKMVLNVLHYTKERDLNWTHVSVKDFTEEVISIMQPKAAAAGVELKSSVVADVDSFEIDSGSVRSALINILENCIDACMDDKSGKKQLRVSLTVHGEDDHIVYEIEDNGVGMDQGTMEKMFTLFYSSKGSRGTGLGMFVANQIIEQHTGNIEVTSQPGEGSNFRVRLPKALPEDVKNGTRAEAETPEIGPQ